MPDLNELAPTIAAAQLDPDSVQRRLAPKPAPVEPVTPPLTTVRVPVVEMGRQAVRQLMIQVRCPDAQATTGFQVRLMPTLVVRHSAAAALIAA